MGITTFRCPNCGELLEYVPRNDVLVLISSMAAAAVLAFSLGYRGFTFFLVTVAATLLIVFVVVGLIYHLWPPKAQRSYKNGDTGLHLTDKSHR